MTRDLQHDDELDPAEEQSLLADESGAVMIMGVFMAVFLVAMLYYLVGLGDASVYRERMQDATDSGAFSAAVTNARGMNFIVMLNIIMAAMMAIVLTLKIVEVVLITAIAIAAVIGFFCGGCTAPAISLLSTMQRTVNRAANAIEPIAEKVIRFANLAQDGIRRGFPALAQARSVEMMTLGTFSRGGGGVHRPSLAGGTFPVYGVLPVEEHVFRETCDRAGKLVGDLVAAPFALIRPESLASRVQSFISGSVQGLVSLYSTYYCGPRIDGGEDPSEPPSFNEDVPRPRSTTFLACRAGCTGPEGAAHPECRPCDGAEGGVGDTDCNNAIEGICHDAGEEANLSGPTYCPPDARRIEGRCSDPQPLLGCNDEDRASLRRRERPPGDGSAPTAEGPALCRTRVRQATSECQLDGSTRFQYAAENAYIVYYKTVAADGTCSINYHPTHYGDDPGITDAQRDYQSVGNDGEGRETEIPFCTRPIDGVSGWGMVGPDLAHPWLASCQYRMPEDYTEFPNPGGARIAMRDPTSPTYQARCNALPNTWQESLSSVPGGASRTYGIGGGGNFYRIRFVSEVFGCVKNEPIPLDITIGETAEDGRWEPPHRICARTGGDGVASLLRTGCASEGADMHLGAAEFQMRALALGREFSSLAGNGGDRTGGTQIANWDDGSGAGDRARAGLGTTVSLGGVMGAARSAGRVSIAQAEYYWDQDEGHDDGLDRGVIEWMWDMSWRGRLRRVHISEAMVPEAERAASRGGFSVTGIFNKVFAH